MTYDFVRLGEHNTNTIEDEHRADVQIKRVDIHEDYIKVPKINDIAVVHLARDVEFTGKLNYDLFTASERSKFFSSISIVDLIHYIDRIAPICLPTSEELQSENFVGRMPFVGNYYYTYYSNLF